MIRGRVHDTTVRRLTPAVTDGLDVVAVGIAHERTEVRRVVLGEDARFVQHLRAQRDGRVAERRHRGRDRAR